MGLVDSRTGAETRLSEQQLVAAAREMRALALVAIHCARSGHPGGSLSMMDLAAALFLNVARLDPKRPEWDARDRIVLSAGHKAPALYAALWKAGFCAEEDVVTLRKIGSKFQGHPHKGDVPGIEISTGSLGQGLGAAVGMALAARISGASYDVYAIMGDGEHQEGSIWEAVMAAGHYKLDNLVGIVDVNRLQIDGWVKDVMDVEPLAAKYRAFNWNVVEIDGHDMAQILEAFYIARRTEGRPTVILARTVKGKGVSFMENQAAWHGVATKDEAQLRQALADINCPEMTEDRLQALFKAAEAFQARQKVAVSAMLPKFGRSYWWNDSETMRVDMEPTRFGFGRALERVGSDPRVVTLHADISGSIKITDFEAGHPERNSRVVSVGIAEQNMMSVAAGLARSGKIPVTGTYGVFASGRPWDQIRTTICYDRLNVKIGGAHGGVSVGPDGATHQALEEIAVMAILPNMTVMVPCDAVETDRLTEYAIKDIDGPVYIRFAREATPVVTDADTPLVFGKANVIRFRGERPRFKDAFEFVLASEYRSENEGLAIIACGPMVPEAMRAAWLLEREDGLAVRVLDVHTVKPIDEEAIIRAAAETGAVLTCEEHQVGGFGGIVARVINTRRDFRLPLVFDMVGVQDRFGESGGPWELMIKFGLTAEHIAARARSLVARKGELVAR